MKFTEDDFAYEALHQGTIMSYANYIVKWATTKDKAFIKFVPANTSMEDEIRINLRTGRQIIANNSTATIDKQILEDVYDILNSFATWENGEKITLLQSIVNKVNQIHKNDHSSANQETQAHTGL